MDSKNQAYPKILDKSKELFYRCDLQGRLIVVTESMVSMLGYDSPDDAKGLFTKDFWFEPDKRDEFARSLEKYGALIDCRIVLKKKDGYPLPVEISCNYFYGQNGEIAGIEGIIRDLTEITDAQNALKELEGRYRSVFEAARNPTMVTDRESFRIVDVNSAACQEFGYSREEFLNLSITDISAEPDKTKHVFKTGTEHVHLRYFKRKDGSIFPSEVRGAFFDWKGRTYVLGSFEDISERLRAEQELRESEEKYRTVFESVSSPLFIVDPISVTIMDANPAACTAYGYTREEMIGLTPLEISTEPEKTLSVAPNRTEYVPLRYHKRKDGTPFPAEIFLSYCTWQNKQVALVSINDITERLETERVLRENENKYRSIFESVGNPFFLTDPATTRFLDINQAACDVYGYTREEMLDFDYSDISAEPEKTLECIEKRAAHVPLRYHKRKDGTVFPIEAIVSYYEWQGKEISLVSIRDITHRVEAERALQESEARYKGVVDSQRDIVLRFSYDGQPIFANEAWYRVTGKPLGESDGGVQLEFVHSDDVPAMRDHIRKISNPPYRDYVEARIKTLAGYRWYGFESYLIHDDKGDPFEGQSVGRDIHENKLAAEAIQLNERRLSLATEAASEGVWEFDVTTNESYISPQIYWLLGYTWEDINSDSGSQLYIIHSDDYPLVFGHVQDNLSGKLNKIDIEFRAKTKSGDYKWVHNRGRIIERNRDGAPIRIGGTITDVTEARQAREALEQAHLKLQKSYDVQREFLNCITHEVRTPLIAVKGYAELLMEGLAGQLNDQQRNYIKKITESSDSLLNGVTAMLEMTRINSGKTDLAYEIFEPYKLVERVISTVAPQAAQKGLSIKMTDCGCPSAGATDATKLTVVLSNLLSNAVKFTDSGAIEVRVESDQSYMIFAVFDTGRGIGEEDFAAIFEEFQQLSATRKYKETGFGIGLSLVSAMVDVLGAELTLSSIKDFGSVFTLRVPILHPSAAH